MSKQSKQHENHMTRTNEVNKVYMWLSQDII